MDDKNGEGGFIDDPVVILIVILYVVVYFIETIHLVLGP
jgi:hypothetical protein